jgi:hypothetical protein
VHVAGHSVPYDIWIDDPAHQVRIGGHGFAIEMTKVRNVVANSIQRRYPRMDISPYDVQCGSADSEVVIVTQGSVITCEFTADAMLMLLGIRFGDMRGHLIVSAAATPLKERARACAQALHREIDRVYFDGSLKIAMASPSG